jgi:hypothetical protein
VHQVESRHFQLNRGQFQIYQQTVIDAHASLAFAKLYLSKVPMTAVDVLNDRVLPFYEEHSVEIEHLLTDNVLTAEC